MSDIWKRKKFGEVLEAFGSAGSGSCRPCVFPLPLEGHQCKVGINRPKTLQNHSRQHRKTKFSELYLSDRHEADFGEEMLRFAVFMKHFSGSLASCRDRPLQNKNNVRVLIVYQKTDVTRPQTHRVVDLCLVYGVWRANCNKIFDGMQSILISRFSQA